MEVKETDIPIQPGEVITGPNGQLCFEFPAIEAAPSEP